MDKIIKKGFKDLKKMIVELEKAYEDEEIKIGTSLIFTPNDVRNLFAAMANIAVLYENLKYFSAFRANQDKLKDKVPNSLFDPNEVEQSGFYQ